MKLFGLHIPALRQKSEPMSIDTVIRRLEALQQSGAGIVVTPETAMQSPTVHAIVTAISRSIAALPVKVLQKTEQDGSKGRARKEELPRHPVSVLLSAPNDWQDRVNFWLDATSQLVRYGNFYAFKARGQTGPIRRLVPLLAGGVIPKQDAATLAVRYQVRQLDGTQREYDASQVLHARGPARDYLQGDSPVYDVREAIALELAAERMGSSVFGNDAMPSLIFNFQQGYQGFKTDEERAKFVEDFQHKYSGRGRFKALLLPKGIEVRDPVAIDNDKAQYLATRQYQRTVIAGAFGCPPHLVGDLSRGTFNNVEQQSLDFILNVVLPVARVFEAAMERSLLTDDDRRGGVIIRFNLDGALRGDFKSRQEGLAIQRQNGVISPNDWREAENMNPISRDNGGEDYWRKGPSGQDAGGPAGAGAPGGAEPAGDPKPAKEG